MAAQTEGRRHRGASPPNDDGTRMTAPLVVVCAVGLSSRHIGSDTPVLARLAGEGHAVPLQPALPAVTTTGQTTMLTGVLPAQHGIVGNGWYFRELGEIWLWRQSEALIQAPLLWHGLQVDGRPLRVLKHFWWYAMSSTADVCVTPRPVYHHDGRKAPDCYASDPALKARLTERHGTFPLFHFWGPTANIRSSRWIAESFCTAYDFAKPDLSLVYLPHLDYDFQRYGPAGTHVPENLRALDACVKTVVEHAEQHGARVLVVSEYGIEPVCTGVAINRHLRTRGFLSVTRNAAGELLDPGTSRAFAVCDHQVAHVYVRNAADVGAVRNALRELPGVGDVRCGAERRDWGLDHARSGEIVCMTEPSGWFMYDYWLDDDAKPDFARCVEIHKKPGYDPRETRFDPHGGKWRACKALLRKKLGLRYVLDPLSLDPDGVGGSHGRPPSCPENGPVIILPPGTPWSGTSLAQQDLAPLIQALLLSR